MFFKHILSIFLFGYYVNSQNFYQLIKKKPNTHFVIKLANKPTILVKVPQWKPKTERYDPKLVDWNGVISGCRAACRFDRRLCNFYIRAAAHDSLSISEGYGGADGSLILTQDELSRPENNYDSFSYILSKNVLSLAKKYNSSVADILAVCGAVSTEFLGGPTIISDNTQQPFMVGRFDKLMPNPGHSLAGANINTTGFSSFAKKRNLTVEEMTALLGSHSLIDHKACFKADGSECDPFKEKCDDVMMYKWSNIYYKDVCTPKIGIYEAGINDPLPLLNIGTLRKREMCKFTSPEFRQSALDVFNNDIVLETGDINILNQPDTIVLTLDTIVTNVIWVVNNMVKEWMYTINDAYLGLACQGVNVNTQDDVKIKNAMNLFKTNSKDWDIVYVRAYKKMINTGATWSIPGGLAITGDECRSGYISNSKKSNCSKCNEIARRSGTYNCPKECICSTSFKNTDKFYNN